MSVDTKGVVATDCKDVFRVAQAVETAIARLVRPHWAQARGTPSASQWELPHVFLHAKSEAITVEFQYAGERRMLWVFFTCDSDNKVLAPHSLSLSMGYWGSSELLMGTALSALADLGPVYIDRCDADDEGYVPFEPRAQSVAATACEAVP